MAKSKTLKTAEKIKILIANGVNLDLLGQREPEVYGTATLQSIETLLKQNLVYLAQICGCTANDIDLEFYQSNVEGDFLVKLSESDAHGFLLNPGAWTHTSLALADRLRAINKPFVEVHISNTAAREDFRKFSYLSPHAKGVVFGFGINSYLSGLLGLLKHLTADQRSK